MTIHPRKLFNTGEHPAEIEIARKQAMSGSFLKTLMSSDRSKSRRVFSPNILRVSLQKGLYCQRNVLLNSLK